jgi:hypothetical protein
MTNPARFFIVPDRITGLFLFLPVPLVLSLLTRFPLGPLWSPLLAIALVATHRIYARPFALARSGRRCLWCGGQVTAGGGMQSVGEPGAVTTWATCRPQHARRLAWFLGWLQRHKWFVRIGILGNLLLYLALSLPIWIAVSTPWTSLDIAAAFQAGIAITVLPVGWLAGAAPGDRQAPSSTAVPQVPFPVHVQALVGTMTVVWLFRVVGLIWLALAVGHFAGNWLFA